MNREFLATPQFTKKNLLENVLAPHGFNAVNATADISAVAKEVELREFSRRLLVASNTMLLLSLYNVTRLGVLSPSGRTAALAGTAFFSLLSYSSYSKMGCNHAREEPAQPTQ